MFVWFIFRLNFHNHVTWNRICWVNWKKKKTIYHLQISLVFFSLKFSVIRLIQQYLKENNLLRTLGQLQVCRRKRNFVFLLTNHNTIFRKKVAFHWIQLILLKVSVLKLIMVIGIQFYRRFNRLNYLIINLLISTNK